MEQVTTGQVFARLAASILDVNDATENDKQRERIRRAVLDGVELAELRIRNMLKVQAEVDKNGSN